MYAIAFNNPYGDKVITGSFDKTCKVVRTSRRPPHTNAAPLAPPPIFAVVLPCACHACAAQVRPRPRPCWLLAFPARSVTRGFIIPCPCSLALNQVWNANTGELYHTLRGHATEIVCLSFNPQGTVIATGFVSLVLCEGLRWS